MARLAATVTSLVCWLCTLPFVFADGQQMDVQIRPVQDLPAWATDATLQLNLTTSGDANPLQYAVIPLTSALGLNESSTALRVRLPLPRNVA